MRASSILACCLATACAGETDEGRRTDDTGSVATEYEPPNDAGGADLLLLVDRGFGPAIFEQVTRGIGDFMTDPRTAGTFVALQAFGAIEGDVCDANAYVTPLVPLSEVPQGALAITTGLENVGSTPEDEDSYPAPALKGAFEFAHESARQRPERNTAIVLILQEGDTFCSDDNDYRSMVGENLAMIPRVGLFGVELRYRAGEEPTAFSSQVILGDAIGAGISWRPDPIATTVAGEITQILLDVRTHVAPGDQPDTPVESVPTELAPGQSRRIDPCKDMPIDETVFSGCLATHWENSCAGDLEPELSGCFSMVSGCTATGAAYVGSFLLGCEIDASLEIACDGLSTDAGVFETLRSFEGVGPNMGYGCECDPATGQARGAQIVVNGQICGVKPSAP
jgi:hypothetical protein